MFSLRIHSVDFPESLPTSFVSTATRGLNPSSSTSRDSYNRVHPTELRGVAHLFRQLSPQANSSTTSTTIADSTSQTTLLFIVAVPNYLSSDDFLLFCGPHLNRFTEVLFLRNDAIEDRYSVLIRLESQSDADAFYCASNGKRFKPSEAEICHIYFTQSVEFNDLAEISSTSPPGFMELPTCPICLERLDQDTSGIQSTICDHSFQCSCISKWTYLSCQVCRFCQQQDDKPSCSVCGTLQNLWICLICGFVGCGRYERGHAIKHWTDTMHHFSLDLETQQIWDYVGDKYVHRLNQTKSDSKSAMTYASCVSNGEGGPCGYEDDSGLDGALFNSKVDAIVDEYNHLLASQLEIQRQHYEALYTEAKQSKESSVSKAVEKAVFSKMHDLEGQLEGVTEERNDVAERNKELLKNQEFLQQKHKEIEKRLSSSLQSKDEKILDLEEQIRDLKIYVEAQRMIANMKDSEDIKGGAVLPTEASRSSQVKTNRRGRQGRKRN